MCAKFGDSTCDGVDVVLQTDKQTDRQTDKQTDEKSVRDRGLAGIYFLYAILDKYGGRTTWPMTSSLTYFIHHGDFFAMSHFSIFSIHHFWRYRGAKFFGFSKMAAEPRDLWRHHQDILFPMKSSFQWAMSQFFIFSTFGDMEVQSFSVFPRWRPNHVTDDIIINIFYSPSRVLYNEPCLDFFCSVLWEI